jgi:type IX secretion system substrate protein
LRYSFPSKNDCMKKPILFLISCLLTAHGFAQSDSNTVAMVSQTDDVSVKMAKPDALLYPNPCRNKVSLQVTAFEPGMVAIRIMDISGNVLKEESRLLINGDDEEIVLFFFLPAGIYFVTMQEKQLVVRKKLVVE